jgi:hypothetical protein
MNPGSTDRRTILKNKTLADLGINYLDQCPNRSQNPNFCPGSGPTPEGVNPGNGSIDGCSVPGPLQKIFTPGLFIKNPGDPSTNQLAPGFHGACAGHDICYQTCRSDRSQCDGNLYNQLIDVCVQFANTSVSPASVWPSDPAMVALGLLGFKYNLGDICFVEAGKVSAGLAAAGYFSGWFPRQKEVCVCCAGNSPAQCGR